MGVSVHVICLDVNLSKIFNSQDVQIPYMVSLEHILCFDINRSTEDIRLLEISSTIFFSTQECILIDNLHLFPAVKELCSAAIISQSKCSHKLAG